MRVPHLSPSAYRRVTIVAAIFVAIIIVSGAAVRLTASGLGCPQWPNCDDGQLTAVAASDSHQWIESLNRMFTGAVSIVLVAIADHGEEARFLLMLLPLLACVPFPRLGWGLVPRGWAMAARCCALPCANSCAVKRCIIWVCRPRAL